jgi:hypothetical protein
VGERISYIVCGAECYLEFCLSEDVGNVGCFLAYVGEAGPFLLSCSGRYSSYRVMDRGFVSFDRKSVVVLNVVDNV